MKQTKDAGLNSIKSYDEITKKPFPELTLLNFEGAGSKLDAFNDIQITAESIISDNPPCTTWNGAGVMARGNISGVSAASKAGKTAFMLAFIVGLLSIKLIQVFKNLVIEPNINKLALISIDTEQSEYDQQLNLKTVLKRLGLTNTPPYFLAYNFRQLLIGEFKNTLNGICEAAQDEFGGISAIVIDGGADFIKSVNDEESSYDIVQYFTHLAIKYNCPVVIVVHQNPGSDKERGHFGSQIQRKCYGLISISKENGVSKAEAKMMRRGDASEMKPIYFAYSKEHGYHIEVEAPEKGKAQSDKTFEKMRVIANEVFSTNKYKYGEAISLIMENTLKGERTAKEYLKNMVAWKIIYKDEKDLYGVKIFQG